MLNRIVDLLDSFFEVFVVITFIIVTVWTLYNAFF